MDKQAYILFTRVPVPHRVKTRLLTFLSGEECAALQSAMTLDTARTLSDLGGDLFVFYSDEGPPQLLGDLPTSARLYPQHGADLGLRMCSAIETVLALEYRSYLLLGSDLPLLRAEDVRIAGDVLTENDVVLCPSPDGGYWLVGMHAPFHPLFQGQHYGTESVLRDAIACCKEHDLRVCLGPVLGDLDTPGDLLQLLDGVASGRAQAGRCVTAWLQDWSLKPLNAYKLPRLL